MRAPHRGSLAPLRFATIGLMAAGCNLRTEAVPEPSDPAPAPRASTPSQAPDATAVQAPEGFRVEVVMTDLTYPTSVEFDDRGGIFVAEAGAVYGDPAAPARLWHVASDGRVTLVTDRLNGPVTDLLWHDGRLYVSHRGKVSIVRSNGQVVDLVTDLPSHGDHHNNQLAVGPDGLIYFGQGTATNSGVVGLDNLAFGWLALHPEVHDRPARDVVLRGEEFTTPNAFLLAGGLDETDAALVSTAAFAPFGRDVDGDTREGVVKANGTILRFAPDGGDLDVYAWGLRNPFGLAWGPGGRLYASENGFDERGSRPIANDPDDLYVIKEGAWYGWPDYAAGVPVTDARFEPAGGPEVEFLMAEHPPVESPLMTFEPHAGVTKLAYHAEADPDHLYMAIWGDIAPLSGRVSNPEAVAPRVVQIDPHTGAVTDFLTNRERSGRDGDHASVAGPGLRRPVDVAFSPDGASMYVVDIGVIEAVDTPIPALVPHPGTGVVWRVVREGTRVDGPPTGLSILRGRGSNDRDR